MRTARTHLQVGKRSAGRILDLLCDRQAVQVERFQRLESKPIPAHFDYAAIPQLRTEAKEKFTRIRPTNLGQASRISGISPADLAVLLVYLGPKGQELQPAASDGAPGQCGEIDAT